MLAPVRGGARTPSAMPDRPSLRDRLALPLGIYLISAGIYVATLGPRALPPSPDNHFVHLANSLLHGRLDQGGDPPGTNDWACYDTELRGPCPNQVFHFEGADRERYRWYVSFPPFPAVVVLPFAAAMGTAVPDRLVFALFAGLGPALLYVLLRALRERGSGRTRRDDLLLTALFAFGSVFFFVAVQGTVWFAAHVVSVPLLCAFLLASLDARRPFLAGLFLACLFLTRPTTSLFGIFFVAEALRASRRPSATSAGDHATLVHAGADFLRGVDPRAALRRFAPFAVPLVAVLVLAAAMNAARFDDPFEFGHRYLQIHWRPRIEKWGLFNYHYLSKNLAVFLAALPWLSAQAPHVVISRHGLALWFTTPQVLLAAHPKRTTPVFVALALAVVPVAVFDLCYQNSGWVQFGYRFALDYLPAVFAMIALSGRRFGAGFVALLVFAIGVNTFGVVTFDRMFQYYDGDGTQNVIFQPD